MERQIKFRAWSEYFSKMFFWDELKECAMEDVFTEDKISDWYGHLMQFTGLKDKNKTEIYEGDIVKWSSWVLGSVYEKNNPKKINVVEWSTKRGKWFVDKDLWDLGAYSDIEVIGNIYENPELIPSKD